MIFIPHDLTVFIVKFFDWISLRQCGINFISQIYCIFNMRNLFCN